MITVTRKTMKPGMIIRSLKSGKFMFIGEGRKGRVVVIHLHDFKPISPAHDEWEVVGVNAKLRRGRPCRSAVGK
jgi:hypothetical protein